jgi:SAM-dependent methyltransferase
LSSYTGLFAEYYDTIYADKPYAKEASFIDQLLREQSACRRTRLLDVACGTGRHAFEFEKLGYGVTAVDYSDDLLSQARQSARARGSAVHFARADMRTLDLGPERFDAATCLFDSIGYVQTNDAVTDTFRGIHRYLSDDGIFVLEYWHAPAMLNHYEPCRVGRWTIPLGSLVRTAESRLDLPKQLCHVAYTLYLLRADGTYSVHSETQSNRFFLPQEMRALLSNGGFKVVKQLAGYDQEAQLSESVWHVLAVAKKA